MSIPSLALASLTATYTDSEGEEDPIEEENGKSPKDDSSANSNNSRSVTPPVSVSVTKSSIQVAQLVSYHDDTMVSDDEMPAEDQGYEATPEEEPQEESAADGVKLFPEPTGRCSNELQDKINRLYERMLGGLDMNEMIQQRKDFRNPSIYEKLIQFCSINELGTNYPAHIYDPLRWGKESYYEELAKVQKVEMERREKERKEKTKVEFVSGTAKRPGSGSGAEDDAKKRKSKWDQVGTVVTSSLVQSSQTAVLKSGIVQQSSLTSSVTGTKGTVISAFGSLPKKPRI